jgi:hypothetical protein
MSRIEPIAASKALVRLVRDDRRSDARPTLDQRSGERRKRRPSGQARTGLGDAACQAAFEIHRLSNGAARGLKADLGVRRQWTSAYAAASQAPAPRPVECARA